MVHHLALEQKPLNALTEDLDGHFAPERNMVLYIRRFTAHSSSRRAQGINKSLDGPGHNE